MVVVAQFYYDERDLSMTQVAQPELVEIYGPFPDRAAAEAWRNYAPAWGGWGPYKYEIRELVIPES